ncbi:hypothetical protein FRC03_002441, partial [Tulasnella sp. 419]
MSSPSSSIKAKEKQRWRDTWLPSRSKAKEVGGEVSGALITTLTIAKESLDGVPVPGLKAAVGGVLEIIKTIKKSESNAEEIEQLRLHVENLINLVINPVKDAKITDSLQVRIDKLTADLEHIKSDNEKMSKKGRMRQILAVYDHADTIVGLDRMLSRALLTFTAGGIIQVEKRIEGLYDVAAGTRNVIEEFVLTQAEQDILKTLPHVNARYDCLARTDASACLENTRIALLQEIFKWIHNSETKQKIFWLHGLAGTGKSTVAQTVAKDLDSQGHLGASFFFSRDEADRRDPSRVLPTIAYQLALSSPLFLKELAKCIDERRDAATSALSTQMEFLVAKPLRQLNSLSSSSFPFVIVLDALDECAPPNHAEMLLKLITNFVLSVSNVNLKLFITGRPEDHLISVFKNPSARMIAHPFVLHDIEESIVQNDIEIFLRYELTKVADRFELSDPSNPWPSNDEFKRLVRQCGALFIVASTAVKFLADPYMGEPKGQLHALMMGEEVGATHPYHELDKVYHHVLSSAVNGSKDPKDPKCIRFREVVGAIISVLSPLPTTTLGKLISQDFRYIKAAVNHLRSVIIVPSDFSSNSEQLRVFHLSFPNYLTERCSDPCFAINPAIHHLQLAVHCLNTLNSFLCKNVCKLPNPFALNNEVPDLEEQVNKVVLAHHQYACNNWAFHLEALSHTPIPHLGDGDILAQLKEDAVMTLTTFCEGKLIAWLEVLVLLGCLDKSIPALKAAGKWLKGNKPSHSSIQLLDDAKRLVQRFYNIMKLGGSQVYHSGLAFAPDCALYEQYKSQLNVRVLRGRADAWDPCLSILREHNDPVQSVAFSHDSTMIVSGSDDNTVCIWDAVTGSLIKKLEGHNGYVQSVAFSHDSTMIVSGSSDKTLCIWDAVTGSLIRKLEGHNDYVQSVAFSHDSTMIVSGSDDNTVCIWDAVTGSLIRKLEGSNGTVRSVAFSHDITMIVSGSSDKTVCIWDAVTGSLIRKLEGHNDFVRSVAFSHDSTMIVSGSSDKTVCIWDAVTGSLIRKLEGHNGAVWSMAFSHDSTMLVS